MTHTSLNFSSLIEQQLLPSLHYAYNSLFAAADQAILTLAAKAKVNKEQNRYYEAAQNLRIVRFEVIDHFSSALMGNPSDILSDKAASVATDQHHSDSLQAMLSIKPAEYQADSELAAVLLDSNKRLAELDDQLTNPLMPVQFVQYFLQALSLVDLDIHTKMLVLRMFERHLYSNLVNYVAKLNDALVEQGILPDLYTQPGDRSYSVNAIVDKALSKDKSVDGAGYAIISVLEDLQADDVEKLWDILEDKNKIDAWQLFMLPRDILADLQERGVYPDSPSTHEQMLFDKIPLVAEIFNQLANNVALPTLAKAMLKALLLPYTRIALSDDAFFNQASHPARLLLREVIEVCEAWAPKLDSLDEDSLYQLLLKMVQAFVESERLEFFDYQAVQFDLLAYRESQRQKQERSSQRYVDSAYSTQIAERARDDVDQLIQGQLAGKRLPYAAYKFIQEAWGNVLYVHAMNAGVNSKPWLDDVHTLQLLLSTLKPANEYESRSDLLVLLPTLLRKLREGLSAIDMNKSIINHWFDELEQAHKTLAISIGGELSDNLLETLGVSNEQSPDSLHKEETVAVSGAEPVQDEKSEALLENITQGVWFNWNRPEGAVRCQLAAIIKHADKYIIVDRSGKKMAELLKRELVIKLQTTEMEVVQSGAMFDKTLASVIDDIRTTR